MWFDNLRAMKTASKMTTKEISIKSGVPEPTLEKLFSGVTKDPKLITMQSVVYVLGYSLDELVSGIRQSDDDSAFPELRSDEKELLKHYNDLNPQGKEYILQTLDMASKVYIKADSVPNVAGKIG